jgi:hypothetical protein
MKYESILFAREISKSKKLINFQLRTFLYTSIILYHSSNITHPLTLGKVPSLAVPNNSSVRNNSAVRIGQFYDALPLTLPDLGTQIPKTTFPSSRVDHRILSQSNTELISFAKPHLTLYTNHIQTHSTPAQIYHIPVVRLYDPDPPTSAYTHHRPAPSSEQASGKALQTPTLVNVCYTGKKR